MDVPNVVNYPQREAEVMLENVGLKVGSPEYVDSESVSGYVVKQDPPAYTGGVPEGTEVRLYISTGPKDDMTKVEKYIELKEGIARVMLESSGLEPNIIREYNDGVEAGYVYRQDPEPGTNVKKGRKVDLWVSLGQKVINQKLMTIQLTGTKENVRVQVIRASDEKTIYDKEHKISDGEINIFLEDSGVQSYAIYFDNAYQGTQTVDFTKKESEGE